MARNNNTYKDDDSISGRTRRLARRSGVDNSSGINASNVGIGDVEPIYYGGRAQPVVITPEGSSESDKYRMAVSSINDWFYKHPEKMSDKRMRKRYGRYWDQQTWDNYYDKVALKQPKTKSGNWDLGNEKIKALPDEYKKKMFESNVAARGNDEWRWANRLAMNLALSPLMLAGTGSKAVGDVVSKGARGVVNRFGDVVRFGLEPFEPIATKLGADAATAANFSKAAWGTVGLNEVRRMYDNWDKMSTRDKIIDVPLTAMGIFPLAIIGNPAHTPIARGVAKNSTTGQLIIDFNTIPANTRREIERIKKLRSNNIQKIQKQNIDRRVLRGLELRQARDIIEKEKKRRLSNIISNIQTQTTEADARVRAIVQNHNKNMRESQERNISNIVQSILDNAEKREALNRGFYLPTKKEAQSYANLIERGERGKIPYWMTIEGGPKFKRNSIKGSFTSTVYVPKSEVKHTFYDLNGNVVPNEKLFKDVKKETSAFKKSVGEDAVAADYYAVDLNKLMTLRSKAFIEPNSPLRNIIDKQISVDRHTNTLAGTPLLINPHTMKASTHFLPLLYRNFEELPMSKRITQGVLKSGLVGGSIGMGATSAGIAAGFGINDYYRATPNSLNSPEGVGYIDVINFMNTVSEDEFEAIDKSVNAWLRSPDDDGNKENMKVIKEHFGNDPAFKAYLDYKIKYFGK